MHLERVEINHRLQKDESPGAVAPSKEESEGGLEGTIILQGWREKKRHNVKTKEGGGESPDLTKKVFEKVSTADGWICTEITTCRGKAEPAGVLENPKTSFPSWRTYKRTRSD